MAEVNIAVETPGPDPEEEQDPEGEAGDGDGEEEEGEAWRPLLTGISQQFSAILGEIRTVAESSRNSSQVTETLLQTNRDLTAQLQNQAAQMTEALSRLIPPASPLESGSQDAQPENETIVIESESLTKPEKESEPQPKKRRWI
jgi:hypothetical protein